MNYKVIYSNELYHYGVKGMRWGVRRYGAVDADRNTKRDIRVYSKGRRSNATLEQRRAASEVEKRWRSEKKKGKLDAMADERDARIRKGKRMAKKIVSTAASVALTAYYISPTLRNKVNSEVERLASRVIKK